MDRAERHDFFAIHSPFLLPSFWVEREKGKRITKVVVKSHAFLLDQFNVTCTDLTLTNLNLRLIQVIDTIINRQKLIDTTINRQQTHRHFKMLWICGCQVHFSFLLDSQIVKIVGVKLINMEQKI